MPSFHDWPAERGMDSPQGEYAYVGFADGVRRPQRPRCLSPPMPWSAAGKTPSTTASSRSPDAVRRSAARSSDRTSCSARIRTWADGNNGNAALRTRKLMGLQILSGFSQQGGGWYGGKIYNAEDGQTFSAEITFSGNDQPRSARLRVQALLPHPDLDMPACADARFRGALSAICTRYKDYPDVPLQIFAGRRSACSRCSASPRPPAPRPSTSRNNPPAAPAASSTRARLPIPASASSR